MGGFISPLRFTSDQLQSIVNNERMYSGTYIEVGEWRGLHTHILARVPHSGSNGAIQRVPVAQDFSFDAEIPWNARLVASRSAEAVGFMEELLVGTVDAGYTVACLLAMGDSLNYNARGAGGENYRAALYCPEMLLEFAEVVVSSKGTTDSTGVVTVNIRARATALVQGLRGALVRFNNLTDPAQPNNPPGT